MLPGVVLLCNGHLNTIEKAPFFYHLCLIDTHPTALLEKENLIETLSIEIESLDFKS